MPVLHAEPPRSSSFVLELPVREEPSYPYWISQVAVDENLATSTLSCFLGPPAYARGLALTLYFTEPEDGFLRVFWKDEAGTHTLSANVYEGVATDHQRTLYVPRERTQGPGQLIVQASSRAFPVWKVRWEWLDEVLVLAPVEQDEGLPDILHSYESPLQEWEVNGVPYLPDEDRWDGGVFTGILTREAERVDGGFICVADFEEPPQQARMEFMVTGMPLDGNAEVWVNRQPAGVLSLEVPDLRGGGYGRDESGVWSYAGWRKACVSIPERLIQKGENLIQVNWIGVSARPVTIRDAVLQARYTDCENENSGDEQPDAGTILQQERNLIPPEYFQADTVQ